ncbi:membrane-associated protein [Nocardioides perillae]|uniref:Membrane-associated protein n=1 Tax=Nocardioides perillae TaxID=1119534 RepID=A0A7Y9RU15_9ACTN|nr:membrane-associated protein [Nocardioides perillae]
MALLDPLLLGLEWMELGYWLDVFGAALFWVGLAVIFVECGLLFPFLPGDTLLFGIGLFIATGDVDVTPFGPGGELAVALLLMVAAAFGGNVVGYEIGRAVGPRLYERDRRLLKRRHLERTEEFFDRHGSAALVGGRFVAFVRTFVTVVAGATRMDRARYLLWSFVGAVLWVVSITALGFFLGASVPGLGDNLELALLVVMAFFALPLVWEWWRGRRAAVAVAGQGTTTVIPAPRAGSPIATSAAGASSSPTTLPTSAPGSTAP